MQNVSLVSAIIPCYNSSQWIEETLESVFEQTYDNIEIIVVDDGSEDNTRQVLDKYITEGKIDYYYQENQGPAAARNLGMTKANGKYVAFLDSDDLWKKDKIERQVSFLDNNPQYKLAFSNVVVVNEAKGFLYKNLNQVPKTDKETLVKFFLGDITMNTPTIVVDRKSAIEVGKFDEDLPHREDHFFLMKLVNKFKFKHFADCLVRRRVRKGSMTKKVVNDLENPEKILKLYTPFLEKALAQFPFLEEYKSRVLAKINASVGIKYFRANNKIEGGKFIIKAIYHNPKRLKNYLLLCVLLIPVEYKKIKEAYYDVVDFLNSN